MRVEEGRRTLENRVERTRAGGGRGDKLSTIEGVSEELSLRTKPGRENHLSSKTLSGTCILPSEQKRISRSGETQWFMQLNATYLSSVLCSDPGK